jgi:hypothetical protein
MDQHERKVHLMTALSLGQIHKLAEEGETDKAADCMLAAFDDLFTYGEFEEANSLMCRIDLNRLDTNLVVCLLCSTVAAKDELPDRPKIVALAEARLRVLALDRVKELMRGLY